jgi:hypothetical protein
VDIELGASHHAGLLHYSFPNSGEKHVLIDLSHYLSTQDEPVAEQFYSNAKLDVRNNGSMYSGYGTYKGGFNEGRCLGQGNVHY